MSDKATIITRLEQVATTLCERIDRHQASGRTLTLKVKFSDYQQITRSHTFTDSINSLDTILTEALALLEIVELEDRSIRLLGLSLSNLVAKPCRYAKRYPLGQAYRAKKLQIVQLSLFT